MTDSLTTIADDPRIDPRIRRLMGALPSQQLPSFDTRDELLAFARAPEIVAMREMANTFYDMIDNDSVAPRAGLDISTHEFTSAPDGNTVKMQFIRPQSSGPLPCVYYLHGGGMAIMSAFDGLYRVWGRLLAQEGVAVAMVDFRNCAMPSSAPEVEPFPAGLDDCASGLDHVIAHAAELGIDPAHVVVAGESGGGNLTLALGMRLKREGKLGAIRGLYAMCPFIAGSWPQDRFPSSTENNGIMLDLHSNFFKVAYGIEHFDAGNPLAWPSFATEEDVAGLPPTVISVNECDPLRDEGIEFYRTLSRANVAARCRTIMGTVHGTEIAAFTCPDISRDAAVHLARFCRET